MMIRLFKHGDGSGLAVVRYLLDEEVAAYDANRKRISGKTEVRTVPPEIIRGDPDQTIALIDSNHRKWRYVSGVIAFAAEDQPSQDELAAVMDDFERTAFAGLETDQYHCLWVKHVHKGNVELHFVVPRIELYEGAAFNPAPPRSESYFNAFRDYWNTARGWVKPDDPNRRRTLRHVFENDNRSQIRDAIRAHVISKIELRQIRDHSDVLAALRELEEDGMEIKPLRPSRKPPKKPASKVVMRVIGSEGTSQTYRLTDRIFHQDWTYDEWVAAKNTRENRTGGESVRRPDLARAERLRRSLEKAVARRSSLNRERYERSRRAHARRLEAASEGGSDSGGRGPEDDARDAGTASVLAEQGGVALRGDPDGDRRGDGIDRCDPRLLDNAPAGANAGRDTAASQRSGRLSESDGPRRCWNDPGPARGSGAATMPVARSSRPHVRQNTQNGELNVQPNTHGARIAEIRQSVDRALRQISEGYQAFRRQDIDGNQERHGVLERVREALGRVSDAIGELVSRLRRGSGNRWFCDARIGGGPAESINEACTKKVTTVAADQISIGP